MKWKKHFVKKFHFVCYGMNMLLQIDGKKIPISYLWSFCYGLEGFEDSDRNFTEI